jgi:hypothetical protein
VQWLNPGQGMPCLACLLLASANPPTGTDTPGGRERPR